MGYPVHFFDCIHQIGEADFSLPLADNAILKIQKVVRVVPQKRVVCQALWQGKSVYAKLFFGTNAAKYASRDAAGIVSLVAANILTPRMLYQGELADKSMHVLIFEAIEPASTAEQIWSGNNAKQRLALAHHLVATLATHHNADLLQTDLYLKNFLVAGALIYTLDGDGIRKFTERKFNKLSDTKAMQNFCVLLSKFDVLETEKWATSLVETYFKARAWATAKHDEYENDMAEIVDTAKQYRLKTASQYADKKVFRQCTDVNVATKNTALGGLFYAASSDANMKLPANLADLDTLMQPNNLLKSGNTCTVALAEIDAKKIVIKRYNIKHVWHAIGRAFRPSRAAASWANAHRLNILDIATAKPIALYERRIFGLRGKAYFLAEYLDLPDVSEYFAQNQHKTKRAEAVKNIVTLFCKLYLLQISHGDTKASNIKMLDNKPVLIDLDSMRQYRKTNIAAHVRDLKRFMQNWQNEPALYNAFVKTFKVVYPDPAILIKAGIGQNKEISHKELAKQ